MNPSPAKPPPPPRRSGLRRLPGWLLCLGALVALVGLFYAEEDWRGQRDWNQYRKAVEARGDHLEFQAYIPKPVPDEENFAATPIPDSWMRMNGGIIFPNDLYSRANNYVSATNISKDLGHRHFADLVAWQMAADALQSGSLPNSPAPRTYSSYSSASSVHFETDITDLAVRAAAAPVVLEGMKPDEADFAALREASARPYARYSIDYNKDFPVHILIPHLARLKGVCQHLGLQADAELAAGQSAKALADVKLMLYLADSIKTEPLVISYLVRLSSFQIAVQPVWEGLAEHRWTEAQLVELESCFQHYDFLAGAVQSLKWDRTFEVALVDEIQKKGLGTFLADSDYSNVPESLGAAFQKMALNSIGSMAPAGWYDLERLNYSILYDTQMDGVLDLAAKRVFPGRVAFNYVEADRQLHGDGSAMPLKILMQHKFVAAYAGVGDPGSVFPKAAAAQTAANQAAIACALERYRLANGQLPDKLEALTPQFITNAPNDVLTGQPYKYRRTDDGQFILYSVGWNEKDDGGVPGKNLFDKNAGDWVWDYPAVQ